MNKCTPLSMYVLVSTLAVANISHDIDGFPPMRRKGHIVDHLLHGIMNVTLTTEECEQ